MERKTICVTNLFLDLDNFRFEHQNSQRDAIMRLITPGLIVFMPIAFPDARGWQR